MKLLKTVCVCLSIVVAAGYASAEENLIGPYGIDPIRPEAIAEAVRICATNKKRAEFASTTYAGSTYAVNHLFLCL